MLTAVVASSLLALACGALLGYAAIRFRVEGDPIAEKIDALLPQSQCGQCGYPGCKPYAEAIAKGEAEINCCAPGGQAVMIAVADLLGREPVAVDAVVEEKAPAVAWIDEQACIGCTLCLQACPVDAIVGAAKQMHTILERECTGCELCLPPCPVNCILMKPIAGGVQHWAWPYPDRAHRLISQSANHKVAA